MSEKRVFITGASGSLGKALVMNLLATTQATIVCYSRDPHKQNQLLELAKNSPRLRMVIGDVRDKDRLYWNMRGSTDVIHTAALKYVDAGEYSPTEYTKTNIDGTTNVAEAALKTGIERCLFISTDKCVAAINLYGRTKAVAERIWIRDNVFGRGKTRFSVVRYGNVFDSAGGVMEYWQDKKYGDEITVRTPNPTRFICFLSWGVQWVRDVLDNIRGGEIFVPADLKAISMVSLAEEIAGWQYVSMLPLLPGEKQHEILIAPEEYQSAITVDVGESSFHIINPDEPQWEYEPWQGSYIEPMMYTSELVEHMRAKDFLRLYEKTAHDWRKKWLL